MTPLDTDLKGYLETNSGLENTWPRIETLSPDVTCNWGEERQDLPPYFLSAHFSSRVFQILLILFVETARVYNTQLSSYYGEESFLALSLSLSYTF